MITSTRSSYPGKRVSKELGIVIGMDNKLRPLRNLAAAPDYLEDAIKNLEINAEMKGANAVLGVTFAMNEKALPIVMGTAVILEDDDKYRI